MRTGMSRATAAVVGTITIAAVLALGTSGVGAEPLALPSAALGPIALHGADVHPEDHDLMPHAHLDELILTERAACYAADDPRFFPSLSRGGFTEIASTLEVALRHQPPLAAARRNQADPSAPDRHNGRLGNAFLLGTHGAPPWEVRRTDHYPNFNRRPGSDDFIKDEWTFGARLPTKPIRCPRARPQR